MGGETVEDKNTMMWTTNEGEKFTKEILERISFYRISFYRLLSIAGIKGFYFYEKLRGTEAKRHEQLGLRSKGMIIKIIVREIPKTFSAIGCTSL
jgi:hypothetical protein